MKEQSKIARAMELVASGQSRYAAAKAVDLQPSAVYREIKRLKALQSGVCNCCGAPVAKDGKYRTA